MSKTDKTTPYHVVEQRSPIDHDHRTGECRVGVFQPRYNHYKECAKRVEQVTYCTKQDPRRTFMGYRACWYRKANWTEEGYLDDDNPFTWVQCKGHKEVIHDASIPCACDTWEPNPTCTPRLPRDHKWKRRRQIGLPARSTVRNRAIAEGIAEWEDEQSAIEETAFVDCEAEYDMPNRWEMDRLHEEALTMNGEFDHPEWEPLADWERELLGGTWDYEDDLLWSDEVEQARMEMELEGLREREAAYDGAYGGYSDDEDVWMPFARGQEVYDLLDSGFHVITPNKISTDPWWVREARKEKETTMQVDKETERLKALLAAQDERARKERLATQLRADEKAKVERPAVWGGNPFYNDALDPISPNFRTSALEGE